MKNKTIKKGDIITIDGVKGKIIGITLLETKIETNNKEIIFIPNANVAKKTKNGQGLHINRK